ncbi:MAG TPA: hypothetical protein VF527_15930 [Pyrinomonadaceae bacterium]|jgi:hypothetical protein
MSANESKIDGYLQEKAMNTLDEIVDIVEALNRAEDKIPSDVVEELKGGLRAALHDSTKVVAYLHGSIQKQNWDDVDLILDTRHKGLSEVLFKYGCIPEPEHMIKGRERPHFALRVLQLSKSEAREARRAIYDECDQFGYEPAAQIRNLLEGVTQNTKEWGQFQREVEVILAPHLETAGSS